MKIRDQLSPTSIQSRSNKRVLNAGSGSKSARKMHAFFQAGAWIEIRIDIDNEVGPDIIGSVTDMASAVDSGSFDAVWSSHSLEHLYAHDVPSALAEFKRVLKPDGFALITCPDLEEVAATVTRAGLDHVAYISPVGPITTRDMLFGHSASIARGNVYMAHNTGFTCASLGCLLVEAGFSTVLVKRDTFDLWALALRERANKVILQRQLKASGLDMLDDLTLSDTERI
jgi:predicted SAM-dependent methyltransferase